MKSDIVGETDSTLFWSVMQSPSSVDIFWVFLGLAGFISLSVNRPRHLNVFRCAESLILVEPPTNSRFTRGLSFPCLLDP